MDQMHAEILRINQRLLDSIANRDWATYRSLCEESLTAFEPAGDRCTFNDPSSETSKNPGS
jgi:hypothetical protein